MKDHAIRRNAECRVFGSDAEERRKRISEVAPVREDSASEVSFSSAGRTSNTISLDDGLQILAIVCAAEISGILRVASPPRARHMRA